MKTIHLLEILLESDCTFTEYPNHYCVKKPKKTQSCTLPESEMVEEEDIQDTDDKDNQDSATPRGYSRLFIIITIPKIETLPKWLVDKIRNLLGVSIT